MQLSILTPQNMIPSSFNPTDGALSSSSSSSNSASTIVPGHSLNHQHSYFPLGSSASSFLKHQPLSQFNNMSPLNQPFTSQFTGNSTTTTSSVNSSLGLGSQYNSGIGHRTSLSSVATSRSNNSIFMDESILGSTTMFSLPNQKGSPIGLSLKNGSGRSALGGSQASQLNIKTNIPNSSSLNSSNLPSLLSPHHGSAMGSYFDRSPLGNSYSSSQNINQPIGFHSQSPSQSNLYSDDARLLGSDLAANLGQLQISDNERQQSLFNPMFSESRSSLEDQNLRRYTPNSIGNNNNIFLNQNDLANDGYRNNNFNDSNYRNYDSVLLRDPNFRDAPQYRDGNGYNRDSGFRNPNYPNEPHISNDYMFDDRDFQGFNNFDDGHLHQGRNQGHHNGNNNNNNNNNNSSNNNNNNNNNGGSNNSNNNGGSSRNRRLARRRRSDNRSQSSTSSATNSGSEILNKYKSQLITTLELQIIKLATDQNGCRFLQRRIEEPGIDTKDVVVDVLYKAIRPEIYKLVVDSFGNYLIQRIFQYLLVTQRTELIRACHGKYSEISLNQHGTRAFQTMIEHMTTQEQYDLVIDDLKSHVVRLIKDLNGNHVIQKCLQCFKPKNFQFIVDGVCESIVEVATHRHGCCVLQKCLGYANEAQFKKIGDVALDHGNQLILDAFGNYVVQYLMPRFENQFKPNFAEKVGKQVQGNLETLSVQKFASNVVEKCLKHIRTDTQLRDELVVEVLEFKNLETVLKDPYGNYVVQTALDVAEGELKERVIRVISDLMPNVKNTPYAKKIQQRITEIQNEGAGMMQNGSSNRSRK